MSTTVTTVTTVAMMSFGLALGVILTLALIGLLVVRELMTAREGRSALRWGRVLNIGIVPLLVSFAFILAVKVATAL